MRILGIDPGTVAMGYGVIDSERDKLNAVKYGALTCKAGIPMGERLLCLFDGLEKLLVAYHPEAIAIEMPFVGENVRSAFAVGRAQAIAILAATRAGLPFFEYSPAQVKSSVGGYGASTKEQMQQMVKLELNLPELPRPADAADALAIAITHLREARFKEIADRGK
jgi:crossover junction endodeoxyribonuclease RuvC